MSKIINFIRKVSYNILMKGLLNLRLLISHKNTRNGKAFIIIAAESSGNRMLQRFLVNCGCFGSRSHKQLLDYTNPEPPINLVVWRRGFPQSILWGAKSDAKKMYKLMKKLGYETHFIEIRRNLDATVKSQVRQKFAKDKDHAEKKIKNAWSQIKEIEKEYPNNFHRVIYEKFVEDQDYRKKLCEKFDIPHIEKEVYEIKERGIFEEGKKT